MIMTEKIIAHIESIGEIEPDTHDGSYELVRETVKALEKVDREKLNYKDMNLLYFNTVGTFTKVSNYENKIRRIEESNLNPEDKEYLKDLLSQLKDKAQRGEYTNRGWFGDEEGNGSIGMFGSGFSSFAKFEAENKEYADFIGRCTEILHEEDEEKILEIAEEALKKPIRGLGIAGVSQILHCLKPFVFPILNRGEGSGIEAYKQLKVPLTKPYDTTKYVQNTRIIRDFRNKHFSFKNYRVIDLGYRDFIMPKKLEKPFADIFNNRQEATWAFDFIAEVAEKLSIEGPNDPRIVMSLRHGGKALHFIFCKWLIVSFRGGLNEQRVIIPLLKDGALQFEAFHLEDFLYIYEEKSVALYSFPFEKVKDMDEELAQLFNDTIEHIKRRFQNHKRSPYRNRPSHLQELVDMVYDEERRNTVFLKGLNPNDEEKIFPNIWWVNQKIEKQEFIWAPLKNKSGNPVWHWETLKEVKDGDIILHYTKGFMRYVSRVTSPPEITKHPLSSEEDGGLDGWLVKIDYHDLEPPIPLSKFNQKLIELDISQGPIDNSGGVKEGYFFRFTEDALKVLQDVQPETGWPEFAIVESFDDQINLPYPLSQLTQDVFMRETEVKRFTKAIERKGQAIIYGPPGTGKTYIAEKLAKHLIGEGDGFYEITQFHPAYTYEDFMQGIRPQVREDGLLDYRLVPGRFMEFCNKSMERAGICVLIIDEINRANLARVFGELMYLLEYRDKEIPLAGGKTMSIPDNIQIIGTMNTADRSIALVDYALRRRFAFLRLLPNYEALKSYHEDENVNVTKLIALLKKLNTDIGDPHYEIGHSFFMVDNIEEQLQDIWQMEIIPYLEEYFFDQPDKIKDYTWDKVKEKIGL